MTRDADQRIADILQAIDRCRRYVNALDSDDSNLVDMAEDAGSMSPRCVTWSKRTSRRSRKR